MAHNVASCTSCHGVHGIQALDNPLSKVFPKNVATTCGVCHSDESRIRSYFDAVAKVDPSLVPDDDEIRLMAQSAPDYSAKDNVHREALEEKGQLDAPTCNDCHGNHGATPPGAFGATRVAEICGVCHVQSYNDYSKSPKAEIFDDPDYRDCFTCHGNHRIARTSDTMIGLGEGSVCGKADCHGDPDFPGREIITGMRGEIDRLKGARQRAEEIVAEAERKGMDVEEGKRLLVELNTALITARSKIHRFALEPVKEAAAPGYEIAEKAYKVGEDALGQLSFRQWGLAATSLIVIFVAVLLFLKIRQIDKQEKV